MDTDLEKSEAHRHFMGNFHQTAFFKMLNRIVLVLYLHSKFPYFYIQRTTATIIKRKTTTVHYFIIDFVLTTTYHLVFAHFQADDK